MDKQEPFHRILFEPSGRICDARDSQTVLEVARDHAVWIESDCGGKGTCGKCVISAHPAECLSRISAVERSLLSEDQLRSGERLACQACIKDSGVVDTFTSERVDVSAKTGTRGIFHADSAIRRVIIPELEPFEAGGDLVEAVSLQSADIRFEDVSAVRQLSGALRDGGPITLVSHREKGVTAVLTGEHQHSLGIAVDVGTTTLALYLCDLQSGAILSSTGAGNPQRLFGEDVISRIAYSDQNDEGARVLHKLVVDKINELSGRLLAETGFLRRDVDEMVVVGNTTMETLFASFHPHSLGVSPYLPPIRVPGNFRAGDLGIDLSPGTNVHLFPVISGFLGGDIVGAILSVGPHTKDEIVVIIDIGTNGEIVLGNREQLWATSCATGPALEGAHISCGMRAAEGAIYKVSIEAGLCRVNYGVIGKEGKAVPRGICGSGIIDAVAAMRRAGILLPNGRFVEGMPGVLSDENGIGRQFVLAPSEFSASGRAIAITIQDIRQIQLAKAALFAGVEILMRAAGVASVDRVVLTGAFGARFDWENAVSIGMFPDLGARIEVLENAAGMGAILALLDWKRRFEALELAKGTRFVELAEVSEFQQEYINSMSFPHQI